MLGRFLEFRLPARPVAAALDYYRSLGFRQAAVGDIVRGPYTVVSDGDMALGLGEWELDGPTPTFVRPDLKDHLHVLRRVGLEFEFTALADDEFHQAGFLDPNGQLILLIEARTFSPGAWDTDNVSACGELLELSLATRSLPESSRFWEALGWRTIAEGDSPHRWLRMDGHGLSLGFHETGRFRSGLSFSSANLEARVEYLTAKGLELQRGTPLAPPQRRSATLQAPDGTAFYLIEAD